MEIQCGDLFENITKKHRGLKVTVTDLTPYQVHFRFQKGPGGYSDKHEEMHVERFLVCYRMKKPAKQPRATRANRGVIDFQHSTKTLVRAA